MASFSSPAAVDKDVMCCEAHFAQPHKHILQESGCLGTQATSGEEMSTDTWAAPQLLLGTVGIGTFVYCFTKSSLRQEDFRGKNPFCAVRKVHTCWGSSCVISSSAVRVHPQGCAHKSLQFFNSHRAPDKNSSKPISASPFQSPYFFWRFSQTNSTGVLFYCTKETEAVRGNVPDHFKAGLLLLNDFIPFKSPERGRMNGKGPYSRKADLGKQ